MGIQRHTIMPCTIVCLNHEWQDTSTRRPDDIGDLRRRSRHRWRIRNPSIDQSFSRNYCRHNHERFVHDRFNVVSKFPTGRNVSNTDRQCHPSVMSHLQTTSWAEDETRHSAEIFCLFNRHSSILPNLCLVKSCGQLGKGIGRRSSVARLDCDLDPLPAR